MSTTRTPNPAAFIPAVIALMVIGWGGLLLIMFFTPPVLGPRWLFFFFIVLGLTGTALPVSSFLNLRFPSNPPAGANVITRQALWVGIFGSTLTWLNYGQVYSFTLAIVLLVGLVAVEWLLRMRERSLWKT